MVNRFIVAVVTIMALLTAAPAAQEKSKWNLDAGLDLGKAFSIVDGRFVPSTIPSVTALFGPFEVHTASYFYGTRFFEQDTHFTWYQRESATRRWSIYSSAAHYKWPGGQDLNGQVGLRWRLK